MKNFIYIFAFILLISCDISQRPKIDYKTEKYILQKGNCEEEACLDIQIEYLRLEGTSNAVKKMNRKINKAMFSIMLFDENEYVSKESSIAFREKEYEKFKKEFPTSRTGGYEQNSSIKPAFVGDKYLCFRAEHYQYEGGAHGIGFTEFLIFKRKNGANEQVLDLVPDSKQFKELAEEKLRKELNMKAGDKWADFTFLEKFRLPDQIGISEKGFVLVYNPYELRSFADGQTEISIQFHELQMTAKEL